MASSASRSLRAAISLLHLPLQRPASVHTSDHDLERASPRPLRHLSPMDSVLRNRGRGVTRHGDNDEGSSDLNPALTPGSSSNDESSQDHSRSRSLADEARDRSAASKERKLKYEKVSDFPRGWPQLAAQMNTDDVFMHYRGFKRLSKRMLLHCQNDLEELEKKLDELDRTDAADATKVFRLQGYEHYAGWDEEQRKLIAEIRKKYMEYTDVLLRSAQVHGLDETSERDHRQLFNWILANKPLGTGKYTYIYHADDMVSLGKRPANDRYFEDRIHAILDTNPTIRRIANWFLRTDREKRKTDDERAYLCNPSRLTTLGNLMVVLLTVGGIAIPVVLLFLEHMNRGLMVFVALLFVLLFAVSVAGMTGARMQEVMVGTAAYSALVIVFLQNGSQACGGK